MGLFDLPLWDYLFLGWLFVLGAVLGSFLNVCIYRLPLEERFWPQLRRLVSPPSSCPKCGHRIWRRDNVPLLGWLLLRGRCRFCRTWISPRYPAIECLNGLLFVVLYLLEIPQGFGSTMNDSCLYSSIWSQATSAIGQTYSQQMLLLHVRYVYHLVLIEALIVATFIDFDHWIIPDGATLPAMCVGVIGGWAFGSLWLLPLWFQQPVIVDTARTSLPWLAPVLFGGTSHIPDWIADWPHLHGLAVSLAGLIVGGGIVWVVRLIGAGILRREAMGFGDVVLMAMMGSFLGWQPVVIVFFLAPLCALAAVSVRWIVHRQREIPYGPYLSLAALILLIGWKQIWPRVDQIFDMGSLLIPLSVLGAVALAASLLMLQLIKWMFGISSGDEPAEDVWRSADQLSFSCGEKVDPHVGSWNEGGRRRDTWPGTAAGRGLVHEQRWRSQCTNGRQ